MVEIMNRKGQISSFILVGIALVLSISALFVFVSFKNNFGDHSKDFAKLSRDIAFKEQYIAGSLRFLCEQTLIEGRGSKTNFQKFAAGGWKQEGFEELFKRIGEGDFVFKMGDYPSTDYTFEIKDLRIVSESGHHKIERDFDLFLKFDREGNLLEEKLTYHE